jgi:hypothetical protein
LNRLVLLVVAVAALGAEPPEQPIPYSHKQHITMGLKCAECHPMPDPGEMMGIPAAGKCMTCHRTVKKDSPAIQKLAGFVERNQPVPWVRVYRIPGYVFFSHKNHLETGAATCETCHGKVPERERLYRETDISMGGCMNCHRANRASLDCAFCHEQRN